MAWRVAPGLEKLRAQFDAAYPGRNKSSDGTIAGDEHHKQNPNSDHEVDKNGVVKALDITHDPAHGVNTYVIADYMLANPNAQKRLRYIISKGRIAGSAEFLQANTRFGKRPWTWVPYHGANPHDHHVHFSISRDPTVYEDTSDWDIGPILKPSVEKAKEVAYAGIDAARMAMAKAIVDFEARRDSKGRLTVYKLPANDGGGRFEVAGINERYDAPVAIKLANLVESGHYAEAEDAATAYIVGNTDIASHWTDSKAVESYLRDCVFNRGAKGAARILQRAVGVRDDGIVGPVTRDAMAKFSPAELLLRLRSAREDYEKNVVGYRANFWNGLVNRWDKALKVAQGFL